MDKFFYRVMLNASEKRIDFSIISPSEDLLEFLECSTTTKVQAFLNKRFHLKGCEVSILLTFTSFLITDDWVLRDSENPDKVSFVFLGHNQSGKSYTSRNKEQLKMNFQ